MACSAAPSLDGGSTESGEIEPSPYTAPISIDTFVESDARAIRDLAFVGTDLWICAERGGVRRFDAGEDPPVPWPTLATGPNRCVALDVNEAGRVAISDGSMVYVLDDPSGDVVASFSATARDLLWLPGGRLALAQGEGGLGIWAEGPGGWAELGDAGESNVEANALARTESGVAVAAGRGGLRLYAYAETEGTVAPVGSQVVDGYAVDVATDGDQAFVASLDSVTSLDISDPTAPSIARAEKSDEVALAVAVSPAWLVVAEFKQLRVFARDEQGLPVPHAVHRPGGEDQRTNIESRTLATAFDDEGRLWAGTWAGAERLWVDAEVAPHGYPARTRLHFGEVAAGSTDSLVLGIENRGDAPLRIDRFEATSDRIDLPTSPFVIAAGEVQAFEVGFRSDAAPLEAELRIISDDPHAQLRTVELRANTPKLDVGDAMPAFIEVGRFGELITSDTLAGKVGVLLFFASWCSACNAEFPGYESELWQDLAQSGAGDLVIVGLGRESSSRIDGFANTHGVSFPLTIDEETYDAFERAPGSVYALEYAFDTEGVLRFKGRGAAAGELRAEIEGLLP